MDLRAPKVANSLRLTLIIVAVDRSLPANVHAERLNSSTIVRKYSFSAIPDLSKGPLNLVTSQGSKTPEISPIVLPV